MTMINEIPEYLFKYLTQTPKARGAVENFTEKNAQAVIRFHRQVPGYRPTPLTRLSKLARAWKIGEIIVKDESKRFNLDSFKVLGSSYAVGRLLCQKLGVDPENIDYQYLVSNEVRDAVGQMTLVTATDGNHGRGVAWVAEQLRQHAVVYMPRGSARSRVENIRSLGAKVEITDLNYDDTVRLARRSAEENNWCVIQDTAWEGYTEIPLWIMQGYMTTCVEACSKMFQAKIRPTHVFLQAGVGGFSAAMAACLANTFHDDPPRFIIIEPNNAACILASAAYRDGRPHRVTGNLDTIMAGLACGEPNPLAWDILRDFPSCYVGCDNFVAANGIRILANPLKGDGAVEAGESGSVAAGVIDLLANNKRFRALKEELQIGPDSNLLLFNTEGSTDPENYREILWHGKYPAIP
jgi:diaminopropionate ammonia-lyase